VVYLEFCSERQQLVHLFFSCIWKVSTFIIIIKIFISRVVRGVALIGKSSWLAGCNFCLLLFLVIITVPAVPLAIILFGIEYFILFPFLFFSILGVTRQRVCGKMVG